MTGRSTGPTRRADPMCRRHPTRRGGPPSVWVRRPERACLPCGIEPAHKIALRPVDTGQLGLRTVDDPDLYRRFTGCMGGLLQVRGVPLSALKAGIATVSEAVAEETAHQHRDTGFSRRLDHRPGASKRRGHRAGQTGEVGAEATRG